MKPIPVRWFSDSAAGLSSRAQVSDGMRIEPPHDLVSWEAHVGSPATQGGGTRTNRHRNSFLQDSIKRLLLLAALTLWTGCAERPAPATQSFEPLAVAAPSAAAEPTAEAAAEPAARLPAVAGLDAQAGAERVDLYWTEPPDWHNRKDWVFEVEADEGEGFARAHDGFLDVPALSCFTEPGRAVDYRVRMVAIDKQKAVIEVSPWSQTVTGKARPLPDSDLVEEIQRVSFRYFWNYRHPVSGLPREGIGGWNRNMCSVAAAGMMFFNLVVGIENDWISRDEGIASAHQSLVFLEEKADRFKGMFPHWLHGETGKSIPFGKKDDGADTVETAFLLSGALFFREYVKDDPSATAAAIRDIADRLYRDAQWDFFVKKRPDGRRPLLWHWSPKHKFAIDLEITGFTEAQMTYILALASPTHPIEPVSYFKGWIHPGYGHRRTKLGVEMELGRESDGPPLFYTHYSYLGMHPSVFRHGSKNYFEHFQDFCQAQIRWAERHRPELGGGIWGMTAGLNPDGYGVQYPGRDNGTITASAFLASWPYAPEEANVCLENLYLRHARAFWGPFGFRDGMNLKRGWYSDKYIAISVGPVAPMIENHKTGLCWKIGMRVPEIRRGIEIVRKGMPPPH